MEGLDRVPSEPQKARIVRAFISPVSLTWSRQLRRQLDPHGAPSSLDGGGSFIAAIVAVTGTLEGYVLYYFAEKTASKAARDMAVQPRAPGGNPALAAVDEIMRIVASNATRLMTQDGHSCDVQVLKVFRLHGLGLTGNEKWTGAARLMSKPAPGSVNEADTVLVFVDIGEPGDARAADYDALEEIASKQGRFAPGTDAARRSAAPTKPDAESGGGQQVLREVEAKTLRAKRIEVIDSSGAPRAVVSTLGDGSPSIVLSDKDGRMRAVFVLGKTGRSRIMFLDELGRRVWEAPQDGRIAPPGPGARRRNGSAARPAWTSRPRKGASPAARRASPGS